MTAYYNEIDEYPADWLENLIREKLIAPGVVDRRCITEVDPRDLRGFSQVHLFAGIGGWSLAFRRAGIGDGEHAWSVSCPCPPWSRARIWHRETEGKKDQRDLWPAVMPLVRFWRPRIIYGEQVAGKKVQPWIRRTCKTSSAKATASSASPGKQKTSARRRAASASIFLPTLAAREGKDWSRPPILARLDRGDGVAKRICALSLTRLSSADVLGLNPSFGAAMMGFPPEWDACAPTETRSTPGSRAQFVADARLTLGVAT